MKAKPRKTSFKARRRLTQVKSEPTAPTSLKLILNKMLATIDQPDHGNASVSSSLDYNDTNTANNAQPDYSAETIEYNLQDLPENMQTAVKRMGWTELMLVQKRAIPMLLNEQDVMVQSRTGSGKTAAYILPMLQLLDKNLPSCQALVLTPTRELALQVQQAAEQLFATDMRSVAVYGGVAHEPQEKALRQGVQIVVGTPGRILDHLLNDVFDLSQLRLLILDEADRMLSMGFYPDMLELKKYLPGDRHVPAGLFSATFPPFVLRVAGLFLDHSNMLNLSRDHVHVAEVSHVYYDIPKSMQKDRVLVRILEIENPESALIFCNTKVKVNYVATVLSRFGYDVAALSSDLEQGEREKVLGKLRTNSLRLVVATDVAARGIDIADLSHVIQYEIPDNAENYIHRAGRTGRAGAAGIAISLVANMEKIQLLTIQRKFNLALEECPCPTEDDVANIVSSRLLANLESKLRARGRVERERLQQFLPLIDQLANSSDGREILAMVMEDVYYNRDNTSLIIK